MTAPLRPLLSGILLLLATLVVSPSPAEESLPPRPPPPLPAAHDVRVTRQGDAFRIEVDMQTAAPLPIAWSVLTDFERMASFVPNLERSQITERRGNRLRVEQQGKAWFGPFSISFGSTRDIELLPMREIRSHQRTGTARAMSSTMRLLPEATGTRLEYRAELTPDGGFMARMVGPAAIRHETAEQFSAILGEISRREALAERPGNPP